MTCRLFASRVALLVVAVFAFGLLAASAADIPAGTHVLLKMENSVTTRTAKTGDYVYMRTASPIANAGQIVVPVGSYVQGIVAHVKPSGRIKGRAQLGIRLETLTLASGKVLKFAPRLESVDANGTDQKIGPDESTVKQGGGKAHDTATVAIWAGQGAAIGGLADRGWKGAGIGGGIGSAVGLATVLATRGRPVELHPGSSLDVVFDRALTLD